MTLDALFSQRRLAAAQHLAHAATKRLLLRQADAPRRNVGHQLQHAWRARTSPTTMLTAQSPSVHITVR